jgi:cellulose synthase/poly-beta-1,6-N-acetylglucosamine synthase-like glycosyltransferase
MKILIGTSVRQEEETFRYYLQSLDNLKVPAGVQAHKHFVLHNCDELIPVLRHHTDFATRLSYESCKTNTEYIKDEETHHWKEEAIHEISGIKNHILEKARQENYDYMFFVDSDLILHPDTLWHLISQHKDIIAEVFWTKWKPTEPEAPNAWDYDTYAFASETAEKRWEEWRNPGVYQVGMTGACTLLSSRVIQNQNVNYSRVYNVTFWGEDRHFCLRVACNNFGIWLDTNYPATHLYRPSEVTKYRENHQILKYI